MASQKEAEREREGRCEAEQALTKKHIKCDGKQYEKRIHLSDKVHSEMSVE